MRGPIAAMGILLAALGGCSASNTESPVQGACTPSADAGSVCPGDMQCLFFSTQAADGTCQESATLCVQPCASEADCAKFGKNVTCSGACGAMVCTPTQ